MSRLSVYTHVAGLDLSESCTGMVKARLDSFDHTIETKAVAIKIPSMMASKKAKDERIIQILKFARDFFYTPGGRILVVHEAWPYMKKGQAVSLEWLKGGFKYMAAYEGIDHIEVSPPQIELFALSKNRKSWPGENKSQRQKARKDAIKKAAEQVSGLKFGTQDEADAYCMARMGAAMLWRIQENRPDVFMMLEKIKRGI